MGKAIYESNEQNGNKSTPTKNSNTKVKIIPIRSSRYIFSLKSYL